MHSVFEHIVSMQVELNERTASNWLEAEFDWDAAILVECAESIDSTNWK
ncbi:dUTP diphosphatase [Thiomicrospira microaerophila]|nr:dUTP diphosphatase [Thiomicrospira microaerophila]